MAQTTGRQRRTTGRVMHEFKHGELKSGPDGRAGKVKSRKQAIAIALKEAGASRSESKSENAREARKTAVKESRGQTAQQAREGKASVGASRRSRREPTRQELYAKAQRKHIAGRSRMNKAELQRALGL